MSPLGHAIAPGFLQVRSPARFHVGALRDPRGITAILGAGSAVEQRGEAVGTAGVEFDSLPSRRDVPHHPTDQESLGLLGQRMRRGSQRSRCRRKVGAQPSADGVVPSLTPETLATGWSAGRPFRR